MYTLCGPIKVGELLTERASQDKHCKDLVTRYEQELKSLREKSQTELRELKERVEKTKEQIKVSPKAITTVVLSKHLYLAEAWEVLAVISVSLLTCSLKSVAHAEKYWDIPVKLYSVLLAGFTIIIIYTSKLGLYCNCEYHTNHPPFHTAP